ncbi:unnamed protein product [Amaranthus hypochondriacus]
MKSEEFYKTIQFEEPIIPQLEEAKQKKVIKSFKKLLKGECFDSWDKGLCGWCKKPILDHNCQHNSDNWSFIVVYDEASDYVIALEMFDIEINTIQELTCDLKIDTQESLKVDHMNSCAKSKLESKGFVHMDDDLVNCVIDVMSEHDLDENHECFVAIEPKNLYSTHGEILEIHSIESSNIQTKNLPRETHQRGTW